MPMQSVIDILKKFNPVEDKYISREFQSYGIFLAEQLGDSDNVSLYIRLAKVVPRAVLEKAMSFVKDANARSKPKLFMWKLKELSNGNFWGTGVARTKKKKIVKKAKKKEELPLLGLDLGSKENFP